LGRSCCTIAPGLQAPKTEGIAQGRRPAVALQSGSESRRAVAEGFRDGCAGRAGSDRRRDFVPCPSCPFSSDSGGGWLSGCQPLWPSFDMRWVWLPGLAGNQTKTSSVLIPRILIRRPRVRKCRSRINVGFGENRLLHHDFCFDPFFGPHARTVPETRHLHFAPTTSVRECTNMSPRPR